MGATMGARVDAMRQGRALRSVAHRNDPQYSLITTNAKSTLLQSRDSRRMQPARHSRPSGCLSSRKKGPSKQ